MRPPSTLLQLNAILVLFCAAAMLFTNEADGQQDTLGLGGFSVPAKGEVDLPSGIVLVNDKDKFDEYYKDAEVKPCNVEFDKDGNIEVFYDDLASTKGCTVDLLVDDKNKDKIKFVAKVEDKEEKCLTEEIKDNLLPFIFNEANNGLTTLTNGPEGGDDGDCADKEECKKKFNGKGKCIKRTMFAIGWKRGFPTPDIIGYLHQVGEPNNAWALSGKSDGAKLDVKMAVGNVPGDNPLVTITALDVEKPQSVNVPDGGPKNKKPICNHPRKATPPPAIWKVKSGEFEGKYFVTFHFFPQTTGAASGPKCKEPKQLSLIFTKDFALGIPTKSKPQPTTTKTTIGSTTATEIKSTTTKIRSTKAATKIRPTKAATKTGPGTGSGSTAPTTSKTTPPGTTEPSGGLSTGALVGIVAGSVLVVAIIVAVVVYFLCCRNGKDAANSEDDEHLEDAEEEEAENAGGDDSANS